MGFPVNFPIIQFYDVSTTFWEHTKLRDTQLIPFLGIHSVKGFRPLYSPDLFKILARIGLDDKKTLRMTVKPWFPVDFSNPSVDSSNNSKSTSSCLGQFATTSWNSYPFFFLMGWHHQPGLNLGSDMIQPTKLFSLQVWIYLNWNPTTPAWSAGRCKKHGRIHRRNWHFEHSEHGCFENQNGWMNH